MNRREEVDKLPNILRQFISRKQGKWNMPTGEETREVIGLQDEDMSE